METILFFVLAYIGGTIGIKLKLPAGALLGSMFFIGAFNMLSVTDLTNISPFIRPMTQIALGTMIGLMFTNEILKLPLKHITGFIILGVGSVVSAILISLSFKWMGLFSFVTGVIAVAPGGIAEMLTLAHEVDADTSAVVMIHIIRFVTIMLALRLLVVFMNRKGKLSDDKN